MQIKDPIQRAGVRLLWAAAIPIQTQARRFLARQAAIRRMCGILTIQAFVRRWLAERDLEIGKTHVAMYHDVFSLLVTLMNSFNEPLYNNSYLVCYSNPSSISWLVC